MDQIASDEQMDQLYRAVGMLVTTWPFLEHYLAICIWTFLHSPNLPAELQDTPVSLKKKAEYFKRAFKLLPQFAPLKDEGLALIQRVMDLKDYRHDIVHSCLSKIGPDDLQFQYAVLKGSGPQPRDHVHWTLDLTKFPAMQERLVDLVDDAQELCGKLLSRAEQRPPK